MNDLTKLSTCQKICWSLAGLTGLMVCVSSTGLGFFAALFLGIAVTVVFGLLMRHLVCTGYALDDRGIRPRDISRALREATGVTGFVAPDDDDDAAGAPFAAAARPAPASPPRKAPAVKTGTTLQGEQELSERKGQWRYDGANVASGAGQDAAPQTPNIRPASLDGPRDGQADDLKQIKGIGPKLEALCHDLGFYHFDQIAAWTTDEAAWVDENLTGFNGRVSRDNWVEQARVLAQGGETDFSSRVDKGGVY